MSSVYSDDFSEEREPFFTLEVDGRLLPPDVLVSIESLSLTEEKGKKAICEVNIFDPTFQHWYDPEFRLLSLVVVSLGYRHHFEQRGPFEVVDIVDNAEVGGLSLKIKMEEGGRLARRVGRRVLSGTTVHKVFKSYASHHGYDMVIDGAPDYPIDEDYPIVQTGETDGEFLSRVADTFGLGFTCTQGKMHLTPALGRPSLGKLVLVYGGADSHLASIKAKRKRPRIYYTHRKPPKDESILGFVKDSLAWAVTDWTPTPAAPKVPPKVMKDLVKIDLKTGTITVSGGSPALVASLPENIATDPAAVKKWAEAQQAGVELVSPATKAPAVPAGKATAHAKATAKGRRIAREGSLTEVEVKLKIGTPTPRPQMRMELEGVPAHLRKDYYVAKVTHTLGNDAYQTTLVLKASMARGKQKADNSAQAAKASVAKQGLHYMQNLLDQFKTTPSEVKPKEKAKVKIDIKTGKVTQNG